MAMEIDDTDPLSEPVSELHRAARAYASVGMLIFPCEPGTKRPLHGVRWKEEATNDLAKIDEWWRQNPNANIGLYLKGTGLVAVDVDAYKDGCGWRAFAAAVDIPETWTQSTPSGGTHYMFKASGHQFGGKLRWRNEKPVEHVDIKYDGYIVLAPSVFNLPEERGGGGREYDMLVDAEVADAPDWLVTGAKPTTEVPLLQATRATKGAPCKGAGDAKGAFDGLPEKLKALIASPSEDRSEAFHHAVGWMKERGLGVGTIEAIFRLHPNGPAEKYLPGGDGSHSGDRLSEQVSKSFSKTRAPLDGNSIDVQAIMATSGRPANDTSRPTRRWISATTSLTPVLNTKWLVKGVLPDGGLCVIYGPPGSGKSFLVLDLAMHLAAGLPWHGHKVKKTRVAIIAPEGGEKGATNRLVAWQQHHGHGSDVIVSPDPINLMNDEDVDALIQDLCARGVGLVVIDTLARAMPGADENSFKDMQKVVERAERIGRELGATVLLVHHTGKDTDRGGRGHSSLLGALDMEAEVKNSSGARTMTVTKQRDGETGEKLGFRLEVVELGQDQDGDSVTSCVAVPENSPKPSNASGLSPQDRQVFDCLQKLAEKSADGETVPIGEWRDSFLENATLSASRPSSNKAFSRSREKLEKARLVEIVGGNKHGEARVLRVSMDDTARADIGQDTTTSDIVRDI